MRPTCAFLLLVISLGCEGTKPYVEPDPPPRFEPGFPDPDEGEPKDDDPPVGVPGPDSFEDIANFANGGGFAPERDDIARRVFASLMQASGAREEGAPRVMALSADELPEVPKKTWVNGRGMVQVDRMRLNLLVQALKDMPEENRYNFIQLNRKFFLEFIGLGEPED